MRGPKPPAVVLSPRLRGGVERLARRQTSPQRLVRRLQIVLAAARRPQQRADRAPPRPRPQHRPHLARPLAGRRPRGWKRPWPPATTSGCWPSWSPMPSTTPPAPARPSPSAPSRSSRSWRWPASRRPAATGRPATGRRASWPTKRSSGASSPPSRPARSSVFWGQAELKPHLSRYWLTPKPADPAAFVAQVTTVCDVYAAAPLLEATGTHVYSTDEMTGIQALERAAPTLPMRPGQRRAPRVRVHPARHPEPDRQLPGRHRPVVAPSVGPTRTEADFAAHIERTIATDPRGRLPLHRGPAEHPSVGDLGAVGGRAVRHPGRPGGEGEARRPPVDGEPGGLPERPDAIASSSSTCPSTPPGSTRSRSGSASWSGGCSSGPASPRPTSCAPASWRSSTTSTGRWPSPSAGPTPAGP